MLGLLAENLKQIHFVQSCRFNTPAAIKIQVFV